MNGQFSIVMLVYHRVTGATLMASSGEHDQVLLGRPRGGLRRNARGLDGPPGRAEGVPLVMTNIAMENGHL